MNITNEEAQLILNYLAEARDMSGVLVRNFKPNNLEDTKECQAKLGNFIAIVSAISQRPTDERIN